MNIKGLVKSAAGGVRTIIGKTGFALKKYSPEITIAIGTVGTVVGVVMACRATTKLSTITDEFKEDRNHIRKAMEDPELVEGGYYSEADGKKDLVITYAKTAGRIVRLYAPSALLLGASLSSFFVSHKIMKNREMALAAAYTLVDSGYKNYRARVREKLGEKVEDEIYRNVSESIEKEVNYETGEEEKVAIRVSNLMPNSEYAVIYDEMNDHWEKSSHLNFDYLMTTEKYLNQKLRAQGYLFLWDVYKALGYTTNTLGSKKAQASHVVGWIYDPNDTTRDNYVSFGLSDAEGNLNARAMEILRTCERNIWLDFNVDGDILTGTNGSRTFMESARE